MRSTYRLAISKTREVAYIEQTRYGFETPVRFTAAWIVGGLATSAVFGVLHGYEGLSGIIANGLTGFVFSGVYLMTRPSTNRRTTSDDGHAIALTHEGCTHPSLWSARRD